ncbi:hypothetical protein K435DRAFT_805438 [Dendrothele bispora CBS 962.96]|uniref:Uncharacterized protein n=1 Tax=Dendrothele bispora (strain CBS 962.96) TaxID=1314807 RepID=A0A4S8LB18_DENBC|nr:hypothetical protein K435DRAFT_805438 [Dendrothele bispora CBS 962.96]
MCIRKDIKHVYENTRLWRHTGNAKKTDMLLCLNASEPNLKRDSNESDNFLSQTRTLDVNVRRYYPETSYKNEVSYDLSNFKKYVLIDEEPTIETYVKRFTGDVHVQCDVSSQTLYEKHAKRVVRRDAGMRLKSTRNTPKTYLGTYTRHRKMQTRRTYHVLRPDPSRKSYAGGPLIHPRYTHVSRTLVSKASHRLTQASRTSHARSTYVPHTSSPTSSHNSHVPLTKSRPRHITHVTYV